MSSDTTSSKILTDDYCKWHANLVDLPSSQTDEIRSRLYKAYMEETGLDPWIKSETSESPQSENADNHILQDSSLETQVRVPQMNVLPISPKRQFPISVLPNNPEERQQHIKMVLERFPILTLKHSFKNNYFDFNRSVLCPLCNKNHKKEI